MSNLVSTFSFVPDYGTESVTLLFSQEVAEFSTLLLRYKYYAFFDLNPKASRLFYLSCKLQAVPVLCSGTVKLEECALKCTQKFTLYMNTGCASGE